MLKLARYFLVPIDHVAPLGRDDALWCGQIALPGERRLSTVLITREGSGYVVARPNCSFDGGLAFACRVRGSNASCDAVCDAMPSYVGEQVVRLGDDFFMVFDVGDDAQAGTVQVLSDELDAMREANRALEAQVTTVSHTMDQIVTELSERSVQLGEQNREQARLSEFVRRVMDTMDNLLVVLDRFGNVVQLNAAACRLFDTQETALVGQSGDMLLSEADRAELASRGISAHAGLQLFHAAVSGSGVEIELGLNGLGTMPADRPRTFLLRGAPLYDVAGKLEGAVIVATDVTPLRRRERMLQESAQRFRDFSAMSTSWLWQTDTDHRFVPVEEGDPHYESLFKGKHVRDMAVPEWRASPAWRTQLARMAAHESMHDIEVKCAFPEGTRWVSVSGRPMFEDGRFLGYRGTAKDVTERRQMEDELRRHRDHLSEMVREQTADLLAAKDAAEFANRMKSEFLSNISHELRTPLHSIMSFSRLGINKAGSADSQDKVRGYFERINVSGERLTSLVDDLLNLAKLESGQTVLELKAVDPARLVSEVSASLEALLSGRAQQLRIDNHLGTVNVRMDPDRFAQVVLNLIGNASKFSPRGTPIEVGLNSARLADGAPAFGLTVADVGPGIPENELEEIFGKFIQSTRTKTGAGGTGLGLAICREIIEAHGGTITAANRPGGGAVFEVLMPMEAVLEAHAA